MSIFGLAYQRFLLISRIIGEVNGRVIILLFYCTFIVPFGLISRFFSDPLHLRNHQTGWLERSPVADDLNAAREQG